MNSDDYGTGRKETFHIAAIERLIGCEFDHGPNCNLSLLANNLCYQVS